MSRVLSTVDMRMVFSFESRVPPLEHADGVLAQCPQPPSPPLPHPAPTTTTPPPTPAPTSPHQHTNSASLWSFSQERAVRVQRSKCFHTRIAPPNQPRVSRYRHPCAGHVQVNAVFQPGSPKSTGSNHRVNCRCVRMKKGTLKELSESPRGSSCVSTTIHFSPGLSLITLPASHR